MKLNIFLAASVAMAGLTAASPAQAALTLISNCNNAPADFTNVASGSQVCAGYYAGQLLSNNAGDVTDQKAALTTLGFDTTGFSFNSYLKLSGLAGNQTINFGSPVSGTTYVAIHYGGGAGGPTPGQDSTAFYRLNLGATSLNTLLLNFGASSDAVLYSTTSSPVPEPTTWAMMIGGFGAIGGTLRRRRAKVALA